MCQATIENEPLDTCVYSDYWNECFYILLVINNSFNMVKITDEIESVLLITKILILLTNDSDSFGLHSYSLKLFINNHADHGFFGLRLQLNYSNILSVWFFLLNWVGLS